MHQIENSNFFAYLVPGLGKIDGKLIKFKKSSDGHFYIIAKINNTEIKFLVDTGATTTVISKKDAIKIGFDINRLNYTDAYNTANGMVYVAPVLVSNISIAGQPFHDMKAAISNSSLHPSLLGMSFLENFDFSVEGDTLTISYRTT